MSAVQDEEGRYDTFLVPYDQLVYAVGTQTSSFGIPGVEKHCFFLKEVRASFLSIPPNAFHPPTLPPWPFPSLNPPVRQVLDAIELRKALVDCFERANLPSVAEEDKRRILSFVVVGGGPTGVEFAGEVRRKERIT